MRSLSKSELQLFDILKQFFNNDEVYEEVIKVFHLYTECVIGADELLLLVEKFFENDPEDIFERFIKIVLSRENNWRKISWFCKNIQEIALQQKD